MPNTGTPAENPQGADAKAPAPPIPPERRMSLQCGICFWNAWVPVPLPTVEMHYDSDGTDGQVRATPIQLFVCAGCGARLFRNVDEGGKLVPTFDQPRNPVYLAAISSVRMPTP